VLSISPMRSAIISAERSGSVMPVVMPRKRRETRPPPTEYAWPVISHDEWLRYATSGEMSSGTMSSGICVSVMRVWAIGAIAFTLTLLRSPSIDSTRVSPMSPAFAAP
jgi:hypothetical protein